MGDSYPIWIHERARGGREVTGVQAQLALPVSVEDDSEVRAYKLALPFIPPSKNVYENWPGQWKSSVKKKWAKAIAEQAESLMMPKGIEQVGLAGTIVFATKARRDTQNFAQALWHWVPDGLVRAGVLVDDSEGKVQIGPNWGLTFKYDLRTGIPKKKRERTLVVVTMKVPS